VWRNVGRQSDKSPAPFNNALQRPLAYAFTSGIDEQRRIVGVNSFFIQVVLHSFGATFPKNCNPIFLALTAHTNASVAQIQMQQVDTDDLGCA
jgi:hypothetical protein